MRLLKVFILLFLLIGSLITGGGIFFLARSQVEARYRGAAAFSCFELHTVDPLREKTWRITINFNRPGGGDPVRWYLWPFGHLEEEELIFGARRVIWPPQ